MTYGEWGGRSRTCNFAVDAGAETAQPVATGQRRDGGGGGRSPRTAPEPRPQTATKQPQRTVWQVPGGRCPRCQDFTATDGVTTWCAGSWCCTWSDPAGAYPGGTR